MVAWTLVGHIGLPSLRSWREHGLCGQGGELANFFAVKVSQGKLANLKLNLELGRWGKVGQVPIANKRLRLCDDAFEDARHRRI